MDETKNEKTRKWENESKYKEKKRFGKLMFKIKGKKYGCLS